MELPKLKIDRFKVLEQLYKNHEENGESYISVHSDEFKQATGLNDKEIATAMSYLRGKDLLTSSEGNDIGCITEYGIDEYEAIEEQPEEASSYFPANIYNIIHSTITDSQIQQGTSDSIQIMNISDNDLKEISSLLAEIEKKYNDGIRENLQDLAKNILDDDIMFVSKELKEKKPRFEKLKEGFKALNNNIHLVGLASAAVNEKLLPLIMKIYEFFQDK